MFAVAFIPIGLVIIFFGLIFFLQNKLKKNINFKLLYFIFGFGLFGILLIRSVMNDGFISIINGGTLYPDSGMFFKATDPFNTIVRWIVLFSEIILLTLLKTRNKSNRFLASLVAFPLLLIGLFNMPFDVSKYYLKTSFALIEAIIYPEVLTWIIFILEFTFAIILSLLPLFEKKRELFLKDKNEIKSTVKLIITSLLICVPFLTFPAIFGATNIEINMFNIAHIGWILSIIVVSLILYFTFKNESLDIKWTIMSVLVFFLCINLNNGLKIGYMSSRFPLQLCNLAAELFVVLLMTGFKPLFRFIYIANPVGALIAIVTLSERQPIFNYFMIHYLVEHLYVFIIPILFLAFGLFEKPKFKSVLRDYFIIFSIYFIVCLFVNTIHNGVILPRSTDNVYINSVNFFYQLECPIPDLTFAQDLMKWKVNMFGQDIHILYLIIVYILFTLIALSFYWIQVGISSLFALKRRSLSTVK